MERAIEEILFTLVMAALLTSLVCWVFLGSWSTTLNVLLAIPTSILGTFIVMYVLGFTLNTYTVLGLTLVVGIVVDDAIMVLENIYRHREHGEGKVKAASVGAREITFAAAAATAAIVAIFLPVAFMKGIIGKFFFQFGVTISVAVLISLLEALTLAPMRLSRMLEVGERATRLEKRGEHGLRAARGRLPEAAGAGASPPQAGAGRRRGAVRGLARDRGAAAAGVRAGPGHEPLRYPLPDPRGLQPRDQRAGAGRDRAFPGDAAGGRDLYGGFVGGFGGGEVNSGFVFVTMKERNERPIDAKTGRRLSQMELMGIARQATSGITGARIVMQDFSQRGFSAGRGGGGFPVEFNIRGRDWDELGRASRAILEKMRESGLVTDVDSDYQVGMPEVQVVPDRNKAADLGISMAEIGETINSAVGGQRIGKFKDKGRRFDIRVRLLAQQRQRPEDIGRLLVRAGGGGLVRLGDIVRIDQRPTLQAITRRDRERAITLRANVAPGVSQSVAIDRSVAIAREVLPENYRAVPSGTARTFREAFDSLLFAMGLGLLVAYMVLASQFNAFTHPFTVLLALPFSISGALLALWIGGQSINVYSMLGLILLMGIAKKNSILLVDFTNQIRAQGAERHEALLQACPIRLRPILMTSIATIAGALPPALAIGPGAELQRPMALSIVGGMIVSTALTLFVVPAAYSLIDDAVAWNDARKERGEGLLTALRAPRSA